MISRRYRYQKLSSNEQYMAEVGSISGNNNVANIPLKNAQNEQLTLQISFIDHHKARIKIVSNKYKRYELVDVLESEPEALE